MKGTVVFICIALCAVSALSLVEDEKNLNPPVTEDPASEFSGQTTTTKQTKTTATTPKTTATTKAHQTTTKAHQTTTKAHQTTTKAHQTTTKAHQTTTKAHQTTAKAPKTTTKAPKTTTPSPKPTSATTLTVGNYNVTENKVICLLAQMALQIRLETPKEKGTFIVQPGMTRAEGGCEDNKANLTLIFNEGYINFMFQKNLANNTVYVDALSFVLSYPLSNGGNSQYTANNESVHLFTATVGHSYSCKSESLYMGKGLYLDVKQDRMQAFNLTKSIEFGSPDHCVSDQPDYRVAIAVGVTLLVLIIIVVVAYLLGRRRRADGYQSL